MKSKTQLPWIVLASVLLGLMTVLLNPGACLAGDSSWWGSSAWWDWSDFRGALGGRIFLARLTSATLTKGGQEFDLKGDHFGFSDEPEPFKEAFGVLYIDRLGIRFSAEENTYRGRSATDLNATVSELEFSSSRVGLDLDLIRYPFFRFGIDYDYYLNDVKFLDADSGARYTGVSPMTLGFHARAIPARIREVPFTIQARFRFPMPFVNRQTESKITDWEISGGLRPAIWETSLYGHSTFSVDLEAGFRSVSLSVSPETNATVIVVTDPITGATIGTLFPPLDVDLKARWQGAFFQVGVFF